MNNTTSTIKPPSIEDAKTQAKRLRVQLEKTGTNISHSKALEILSSQYGFRDWNTMLASITNTPPTEKPPIEVGSNVSGEYLGHAFSAKVLGVQVQNGGNRYKVTIHLDEAVDVVTFDSFSAFRKRITSVINQDGVTTEMNSNGVPILKLNI